MHFKWDSSVARDIASELSHLEEDLSDCVTEMDQCADILRQMQGGELSDTIERYISAAQKAMKGLINLEEGFQNTNRGIRRANELFENNELMLRQRAEGMGSVPDAVFSDVVNPQSVEMPPMFFSIPSAAGFALPGDHVTSPGVMQGSVWPVLQEISQTVVIDQISLSSVVTPVWFQEIIDADDLKR